MSSWRFILILAVLCCAGFTQSCFAQLAGGIEEPAIDANAIRKSLERGTQYLLKQQAADGTWIGLGNIHPHALTSLCGLALLNSGVPVTDPQIQKALQTIRAHNYNYNATYSGGGVSVYSASVLLMFLSIAEPDRDAVLIQENVKYLIEAQRKQGSDQGGWCYDVVEGRSEKATDNSNTQFALLGLHEAAKALPDLKIPEFVWKNSYDYWTRAQSRSGSWDYRSPMNNIDPQGYGSMTCAGIASVLIAANHLPDRDAQLLNQIQCCQGKNDDNQVERGLKWLGKNFSVQRNPGRGGWNLYYLYAMERVGRLTGRRFFIGNQPHDWYRLGCEHIVRNQNANGSWSGETDIVSTCFSLLFLSKGRRPVVIAKAKWSLDDKDQSWNQHDKDVANLTTYVEHAWKKDFPIGLSWQIIDLEAAKVEDLLQSPVLFISGSEGVIWAQQRVQLLRDYVDRGGFIFIEACCDKGPQFDRAIRQVVTNMFIDKPEHQLKLLEPTHPIWRAERVIPPSEIRGLWGVDYGCRTCLVYLPPRTPAEPEGNLGCWWQLDYFRERKGLPEQTTVRLKGAFDIGLNVLAYATNRELKSKDENLNLKVDKAKPDTGKRDLIYLAKLKHPGGCDTAPGALPGILRGAEQQLDFRVSMDPKLIDIGGNALFDYHLVFMHGRNSFRLTPNERKQLREYVERGGTILIDSICSSKAFTEAVRAELKEIFPQDELVTIPANHELMTNKHGGFDLSQVTLRQPRGANQQPLQANKKIGPPVLQGIKQQERYGVIFSPYDLSCALERQDTLECEGYSRDDAERISLNVLLYSIFQ